MFRNNRSFVRVDIPYLQHFVSRMIVEQNGLLIRKIFDYRRICREISAVPISTSRINRGYKIYIYT